MTPSLNDPMTRHLSSPRRRARTLLLDLRFAGAARLRALGFGRSFLPFFAFQFLAFSLILDVFRVHSQLIDWDDQESRAGDYLPNPSPPIPSPFTNTGASSLFQ